MNKFNKNGFTLVEIIVVLVILAILAAIMIPGMTKWIDKAKEKSAIAECRQAVIAAQTIASESYASGAMIISDALEREPHYSKVKDLASLPGEIKMIRIRIDDALITRLVYTTNGITVTYDIAGDPIYAVGTVYLPYSGTLDEITKKIYNDLKANDPKFNSYTDDKKTQEIQRIFKERFPDGLPSLSLDEKKMLTNLDKYKPIASDNPDDLNWRPILTADGSPIIVASQSDPNKPNPLACMIYYNGSYYYWQGYDRVDNRYVGDKNFDISLLKNAGTTPQDNSWIRIE